MFGVKIHIFLLGLWIWRTALVRSSDLEVEDNAKPNVSVNAFYAALKKECEVLKRARPYFGSTGMRGL